MTFAIIPAAGHSARMGRPKLAIPIGDRTVLESVIAALRGGGVDRVLVVIGPHVSELAPLATAAGAEVCPLPEPTPDMRTTVVHGLHCLEERYRPRPEDYWVLAPGDHPSFGASIVSALLAVAGTGGKTIVVPVHGGRRGHVSRRTEQRHVAATGVYHDRTAALDREWCMGALRVGCDRYVRLGAG